MPRQVNVLRLQEASATGAQDNSTLTLEFEAAKDRIAELEGMMLGRPDVAIGPDDDREAKRVRARHHLNADDLFGPQDKLLQGGCRINCMRVFYT